MPLTTRNFPLLADLAAEEALHTEIHPAPDGVHHALELGSLELERVADSAFGFARDLVSGRAEPAHDGRAMHAMKLGELVERDASEQVKSKQVSLARLEPGDRGGERFSKRIPRTALQQLDPGIEIESGTERSFVEGRFPALLPEERERLARGGHLDQARESSFAGVVFDAKASALAGDQQLLARALLHFVELGVREAEAREAWPERREIPRLEHPGCLHRAFGERFREHELRERFIAFTRERAFGMRMRRHPLRELGAIEPKAVLRRDPRETTLEIGIEFEVRHATLP